MSTEYHTDVGNTITQYVISVNPGVLPPATDVQLSTQHSAFILRLMAYSIIILTQKLFHWLFLKFFTCFSFLGINVLVFHIHYRRKIYIFIYCKEELSRLVYEYWLCIVDELGFAVV